MTEIHVRVGDCAGAEEPPSTVKGGGASLFIDCSVLSLAVVCLALVIPWCTFDGVGPVGGASRSVKLSSVPANSSAPFGVNIGGWLILERWMGLGRVFQGTDDKSITSEWELCEALGMEECTERINRHRRSVITAEDFVQIRLAGFDAVRVPFGYWLLERLPGDRFVGNGTRHLDDAVRWARAEGLRVVLDMHGVPGQQGWAHHTGRANDDWSPDALRPGDAARVLGEVSQRYCRVADGIQVINEASWQIPPETLIEYFQATYAAIRSRGGAACTVIFEVFPVSRYLDYPSAAFAGMTNIAFDLHPYHTFDNYWRSLSLSSFMTVVRPAREYDIRSIQERLGPVMIGEWSATIPHRSEYLPYPLERDLLRLSGSEEAGLADEADVKKFYVCTQMHALAHASYGSFVWSWKMHGNGGWNVRSLINRGMFNSSWRHEACPEVRVVPSKLDDATVIMLAVVLPACVLQGLLAASCGGRPGAAGAWDFLALVPRLCNFYCPWALLPLVPPRAMPEAATRHGDSVMWWCWLLSCGTLQLVLAACVAASSLRALSRGRRYEGFACAALLGRARLPACADLVYSEAGHLLHSCALLATSLGLLNLPNTIWTSAHPLWMFFLFNALAAVLLSLVRWILACRGRKRVHTAPVPVAVTACVSVATAAALVAVATLQLYVALRLLSPGHEALRVRVSWLALQIPPLRVRELVWH